MSSAFEFEPCNQWCNVRRENDHSTFWKCSCPEQDLLSPSIDTFPLVLHFNGGHWNVKCLIKYISENSGAMSEGAKLALALIAHANDRFNELADDVRDLQKDRHHHREDDY